MINKEKRRNILLMFSGPHVKQNNAQSVNEKEIKRFRTRSITCLLMKKYTRSKDQELNG